MNVLAVRRRTALCVPRVTYSRLARSEKLALSLKPVYLHALYTPLLI